MVLACINVTLDITINMCRAAETTHAQAKKLRKEETAVHAIKTGEQYSKHPNKYKSQREAKTDLEMWRKPQTNVVSSIWQGVS